MTKYLTYLAMAALLSLPAASIGQQTDTISGKVLSVRTSDGQFVIADTNGERKTFHVSPEAKITIEGQPTKLRDIRRGDNVLLRLAQTATEAPVVVAVRVPEPAQPVAQRLAQAPVPQQALPAILPKTASPIGAVALTGVLVLMLVAASRVSRRQPK